MQQEDLQTLFFHAVQTHQQGNLQEAEHRYLALLDHLPDHPRILANLAALYREQDRLDRAEACCRRALAKNPDDPAVLLNHGAVLEARGRTGQAAACFRRVLALDPGNCKALNNLGKIMLQEDDLRSAVSYLELAVRIRPDYVLALNNLGVVYSRLQEQEKALDCFRRAHDLDPDNTEILYNLGGAYSSRGKDREALHCMEQVLDLDPSHGSAEHMQAALSGRTTLRAPDSYIVEVFDRYAPRFEKHIQETLRYTVPADLRGMLDSLLEPGTVFSRVLDLGCGTGLAGLAFADLGRHFTGIDLSPAMLEEAGKKQLYDELHCREICDFLGTTGQRFDLVLASDVLIYSGDLAPLFSLLERRIPGQGFFLCSIELAGDDTSCYVLRNSGRYAHNSSYLRDLAAAHGFTVSAARTQGIRKEGSGWIEGMLFILEKVRFHP